MLKEGQFQASLTENLVAVSYILFVWPVKFRGAIVIIKLTY